MASKTESPTTETASTSNQENREYRFLIHNEIMTIGELKKLIYDREYIDILILIGVITEDELFKHIKFEMEILDKCQKKNDELKKEKTGKYDTKLLVILSDRIHDMFTCLFILFPKKKEQIIEYYKFCSNHFLLVFSWAIEKLQLDD